MKENLENILQKYAKQINHFLYRINEIAEKKEKAEHDYVPDEKANQRTRSDKTKGTFTRFSIPLGSLY